ncbi:cytochrome c biogenesis CcdA family protein [Embleya sp. NBC_00896]|uniref:cytochrome c biogenesis CcdA family protein n=1 Tax=Embleya sp. NBC_00896 TaxID=2975961 RepID=UPI00386951BA|nr:cytochrome c biogenesis protein CcdA [Embleya sp. NBC_00896]
MLVAAEGINGTVYTGSLLAALPIALLAGLISFFSPCVLPLVPGYLSYVTGVSGADLKDARRGRLFLGTLLFVLGFTLVFVSTGAAFGAFGRSMVAHQGTITRIFGAVTIVLGLSFMGVIPGLQREFRLHKRPTIGLVGAPLLGMVFGLGWTPCIGPTLSAVLSLSANEASANRGALLTAVYCLGLGVPFLLTALAFRKALGAFAWVKKHYVWVMRLGGGMLVALGTLMLTGVWDQMMREMQTWATQYTIGI